MRQKKKKQCIHIPDDSMTCHQDHYLGRFKIKGRLGGENLGDRAITWSNEASGDTRKCQWILPSGASLPHTSLLTYICIAQVKCSLMHQQQWELQALEPSGQLIQAEGRSSSDSWPRKGKQLKEMPRTGLKLEDETTGRLPLQELKDIAWSWMTAQSPLCIFVLLSHLSFLKTRTHN